MMRGQKIGQLSRDNSGSIAVEFALLGPLFIGLLLGVLQIGIGMQNYNAVRNVTAEVARATMIEYTTGNKLTHAQIRANAVSIASSAPYLLDSDNLNVAVWKPGDQRVDGATEMMVRVRYQVPILVNVGGWDGSPIELEHIRPIFVIDNTPAPTPGPTI